MSVETYGISAIEEDKSNIAIYGLFFLILVYIGRVHELLPSLGHLPIGKILMGLCLLLYLFSGNRTSLKELQTIREFRYVTYILALTIVTLPFGVWPGGSFNYILDVYLKVLLFFLLIVTTVKTRQEIKKLAWAVVASGLLLGAKTLSLEKVGRLTVTSSYDPNDLAFVMVSIMPMVYYMMKSEKGFQRILLLMTLVVMLTTTIYTGSRGGFVGLCVIALVILRREKESMKKASLFLIIFVSLMAIAAPSSYWDRIMVKDYNYEKGGGGRLDIWINGTKMMLKHPLTGVGVGGFETAEGLSHGGAGKWSSAHNSVIQIGAELGILGFILFIRLLTSFITGLKECRRLNMAGAVPEWLIDGIEVAGYGYIVAGFFLSQAYSPVLYLLIALAILVRLKLKPTDHKPVIV